MSSNDAFDLAKEEQAPHEQPATVDLPSQGATLDYAPSLGSPAAAPQHFPGYQILSMLGKGGMGVVYLAQDLKLPRQVAIKMIRSGSDADEKEKRRFSAEAAVVAQLGHSNIVQIYSIGEHAAQPYFILEYVGGGTLAQKIARALPSPQASAEIVLTLARAVQAAHQHGIIHRDLKPANVLMTPDGSPKITDFGLAKQLDADQALSQAGDIIGSPAYMAPEQAFGKIQDICAATDIYALGAMLYEMLTGQPPFKGATTLETLELVRHQEPVSPRKLQPAVPRDLDTICLKCLRKDRHQRYTSALALAQDLERFLAGEAILARREGVLARLSRKVRRNRAASLLGMALMLTMVATVFVVYRSGHSSRVQDLENQLEADRNEASWTDARVQSHEALIEQLVSLATDRGDQARKLFHESLLDSGTNRLQQPTALQPEDDARVKRMIGLLTPRDPEMVDRLQRTYQTRLRAWEEVFTYVLPKKTGQGFQQYTANERDHNFWVVHGLWCLHSTNQRCQGNVRLEATWSAWEATSQIGLSLHGDIAQDKTGYVFLLETLGDAAPVKPSFDTVRRQNGSVQLTILRNGVSLRSLQVPIADLPKGPVRLEAQREADRLYVYVNQAVSLEFRDLMPLTPHGYYGIMWPDHVALESLRGLRQALPIVPGPLERGDELFAQDKFDEARAFYSELAIKSGGTSSGLEARFKESLALEHLHRKEDALQGYQALAAEMNLKNANKWTVLASFQLWVHFLRNKKLDQADAILEGLTLQQPFEKDASLLLYVPEDVRAEILDKHREDAGGMGHWRFNPKRLHNTKRLLQVEELLQIASGQSRATLLRVLRLEGRVDEAILTVENWRGIENPAAATLAAEYGWMMREKGTPSRALPEVNRILLDKSRADRAGGSVMDIGRALLEDMLLLIERARLHAAMNEWDAAQNDLDEFFRIPAVEQKSYRNWSDACLMLGLVRQERGDQAGAREAWRKGKYKEDANDPIARGKLPSGGVVFNNLLIIDSLCQDLDEQRTETLFRNMLRDQKQTGIETMLNLLDTKNLFRSATGILNRMWHTPKGKEAARKMVLQTCSFREYVRLPIQVFAAEMVREEAIGDKVTAEQEELLWKLSEDAFVAFTTGKIDEIKAMQLLLLWKRGPSLLGGIGVVKGLEPGLRGPAAYFAGLRFQRLGRPAEEALRIAVEAAPMNSPLQRLARIEWEKLGNKKSD